MPFGPDASLEADPLNRYAAFLRGINLGNRRIKNDELRGHVEAIAGLGRVATFLASGNVAFDLTGSAKDGPDSDGLEATIERHLHRVLGYEVDTFVRTFKHLEAVAAADLAASLFPDVAGAGWKLHVIFVKTEPGAVGADALRRLETDDDRFEVEGREAYWLRRGGLSDSKLMPVDLERALGVSTSTMRTHNTVARLLAKFGEGA